MFKFYRGLTIYEGWEYTFILDTIPPHPSLGALSAKNHIHVPFPSRRRCNIRRMTDMWGERLKGEHYAMSSIFILPKSGKLYPSSFPWQRAHRAEPPTYSTEEDTVNTRSRRSLTGRKEGLGCVRGAWRGEPGAPSTCGIHVFVGRTRKYTGKDTWSPVNRAQRGYPPREITRFTARLRRDPTSSLTEIVSSFYSPDRAQVPSLTNAPISRRTRARIFANRRIRSRPP